MAQWIIDGNNVFGSRPDGWWNDRPAAMGRFSQSVAEWCRSIDDDVTLVFDAPVPSSSRGDLAVGDLAGGNLTIVEAPRRGRDAADDHIVDLAAAFAQADPQADIVVVTSDHGLRNRLGPAVTICGSGRFREMIGC